jgi:LmbE family N-acetylglucosaminyl deacetylase
MPESTSRRQFVKTSTAGLGFLAASLNAGVSASKEAPGKWKIVCVGAHPDDPESGCGGTLAKFANSGHEVTIIYLTAGEAGVKGKSHDEAAAIRKQEAMNASKLLGAKPVFAGQIDAGTIVDTEWLDKLQQLIGGERPDLVFTHWPIDSHRDHQAASLLTIQSWMRSKERFLLYFFEVCAGSQTMVFHPTDYVDITETQEQKKRAVYCHVSQNPPGIYANGHAVAEEFHGRQLGVKAAEAFVRMNGRLQGGLSVVEALSRSLDSTAKPAS